MTVLFRSWCRRGYQSSSPWI